MTNETEYALLTYAERAVAALEEIVQQLRLLNQLQYPPDVYQAPSLGEPLKGPHWTSALPHQISNDLKSVPST